MLLFFLFLLSFQNSVGYLAQHQLFDQVKLSECFYLPAVMCSFCSTSCL